jgi:hypothetical protein
MEDVVIVTAGNKHFFDRLVNFIGSTHYWEPGLKIIAFDLGLSRSQIRQVKRMCNVEYRYFNFSIYPPYMKQLRFFAWKPIILKEVLDEYPMVFWEDSGQEFRAPITEIKELITYDGYFFDESDSNFNHFCPQVMYDALGISGDRPVFEGRGGVHAAVLGFRRPSRAYSKVLLPTYACSLIEACISPIGTDLSNYRYDQSIFSLYAHKNGPFIISNDKKFNACTLGYCPEFDAIRDTDNPNFQQADKRITLFSRRGFPVKPYKTKVCYRDPTPEERLQDEADNTAEEHIKKSVDRILEHIDNGVITLHEPHKPEMKVVLESNRAMLMSIPHWIDEETYKKSRAQYGIPDYIIELMDKDIGPEITTADVLTYVAKNKFQAQLNQKIKYLELGISVGKTFLQMGNTCNDGILATIDLENPAPILLKYFKDAKVQQSWRYYYIGNAPRKDNDTYTTYTADISGHNNRVLYISGDVRDDQSWDPLKKEQVKFNMLLSDAAHDPDSILDEMSFLMDYNLIDTSNFFFMYNSLGNDMSKAFAKIFLLLQKKVPTLNTKKNIKLLRVRNWLGINEGHALNGMISTLDLDQLISELQ